MARLTDLDWLSDHVEILFDYDARGRIVAGKRRASRLWVGRTRVGTIWRMHADLPSDVVRDLSRLAGREGALPFDPPDPSDPAASGNAKRDEVPPPPERFAAMCKRLEELAPIERTWRGPAFRFPASLAAASAALEEQGVPSARVLGLDDAGCLERFFPDWIGDLRDQPPVVGVIEGDDAIAIAITACGTPARLAEAGVEVAEAHRGRRLGPRVTLAWAEAIRSLGGEPLYSCAWKNRASRSLARFLGLEIYGEDCHVA